jgi:hypothetical protein
MSVLERMKLWQKLAAVVLTLSVPTVVLSVFYFAGLNADVVHARDAIDGERYTKSLGDMLSEIGTHRSRLREARATPNATTSAALAASDKKLDQIVAEIDGIDARVGQHFNLTEQWQAIRSRWIDVRTNLTRLDIDEASSRHDALLDALMKHVERVALRSGLSLETNPSTFVAIRLAVDDVPRALLAFSEVRRIVNVSLISGDLNADRRTRIAMYETQFERYLDAAREAVQDTTDETSVTLQPAIEKAEGAFATYDEFIKRKVLGADKLEIQVSDAYRASREPTATLSELSAVAYSATSGALERHLSAATMQRNAAVAVSVLSIVLALVLTWLIARSVSGPVGAGAEAAGRFSTGRVAMTSLAGNG